MLLKQPRPTPQWTLPSIPALRSLREGHFLVAELEADKLVGEWSVEKHRDYDGDLSIVILPQEEDAASATFCIHRDRMGIHLKASRWLASALVVEFPDGVRWPSDRLAKVELRRFTLTPRGPDDRRQTTAGRAAGEGRRRRLPAQRG